MANIKSQIKRNRTNEKARQRNVSAKSAVRTAAKKVRLAVEAKDVAKAEEALNSAFHLIDKTVSDGIQHKNTAARQKGELQRLVNSIK
ncbi:MAG: 30S ribosomal protein S20 [Bacilli bacterium]|nr:30S ribosomal protein S20 [Bacilli bacterium]